MKVITEVKTRSEDQSKSVQHPPPKANAVVSTLKNVALSFTGAPKKHMVHSGSWVWDPWPIEEDSRKQGHGERKTTGM